MKKERITRKTVARAGAYQAPSYDFKVRRTLKPGARGTQRHVEEFHESLYCVRYREDEDNAMRYVTVELIREVRPLARRGGPFKLDELVSIRLATHEEKLANKLKTWGATWDAQRQCWLMKYKVARKLRVAARARKATGLAVPLT
jgi:hypothetical protein